jgi:hypothetical protein
MIETQQNSDEAEENKKTLKTTGKETPEEDIYMLEAQLMPEEGMNKGKGKEKETEVKTQNATHATEASTSRERTESSKEGTSMENREILRKQRFKSEITTQAGQEEAKELLETVKNSFYTYPSFLGAHIMKKVGEHRTITAEFGEETHMQESLQIRFDNDNQNFFEQVTMTKIADYNQRSVIVRDIPLNTQIGAVKGIVARYGSVKNIKINLVDMWQTATVTFTELEDAQNLAEEGAIPFDKEYVRILPLKDHRKHNKERG